MKDQLYFFYSYFFTLTFLDIDVFLYIKVVPNIANVNNKIIEPKDVTHVFIPLLIVYISVAIVETLPPTNLVIIKSSNDIANTKEAPINIDGSIYGKTIFQNVLNPEYPKSFDASINDSSNLVTLG
jgi:hypothetical protein